MLRWKGLVSTPTVPSCTAIPELLALIGADLTHLSIRSEGGLANILPEVLPYCPRITQLNLERCTVETSEMLLAGMLSNAQCRALESVHIWHCNLSDRSIISLANRFRGASALQYLGLGANFFSDAGLLAIRYLLTTNPNVGYLGVKGSYYGRSDREQETKYSAVKRQIEADIRNEFVPIDQRIRACVALLSVICAHEARSPSFTKLSNQVLHHIFSYVGRKTKRVVRWY